MIINIAMMNVAGRPAARAVHLAKRVNHESEGINFYLPENAERVNAYASHPSTITKSGTTIELTWGETAAKSDKIYKDDIIGKSFCVRPHVHRIVMLYFAVTTESSSSTKLQIRIRYR